MNWRNTARAARGGGGCGARLRALIAGGAQARAGQARRAARTGVQRGKVRRHGVGDVQRQLGEDEQRAFAQLVGPALH
jgi:hypothetical protein